MASKTLEGNVWRFEWQNTSGDRRRVSLGGLNKKSADKVQGYIQDLADAMKNGMPAPQEAQEWLLHLAPPVHAKLAAAGLVPNRLPRTLEAFGRGMMARVQGGITERTLYHYDLALRTACEYFKADRDIATITPGEALDFNRWLRGPHKTRDAKTGEVLEVKGLKEGTANKRCETLCVMFHDAKRHKLIHENPFADRAVPKASKPASDQNRRFITQEESMRIMEELNGAEMQGYCMIPSHRRKYFQ